MIFSFINTFPMYAVLPFIISVNFDKFGLLLISIHLFSLQMLLFHPNLIIAIVFFYGLPDTSIKRLQRVQNSLARVIFPSLKRSDHITPALVKLHWLPIHKRIKFKIATITFKVFKIDNPLTYLIYFNLITLKDLFAPLTSCFSTNQKSKLLLPLAPSLMLLLQYGTLYLLTYVTLHLFIHSPLTSKPTFSHPSSFAHSY